MTVLRHALAESWRSTALWALGVVAVLLLYLPLFPSIGGSDEMQQLIDALPRQSRPSATIGSPPAGGTCRPPSTG